ncbi:MAG: hybrid sensor histidine kinase/response regulator [Thermoanaerobaculia bacterium]
MNGRPTILIVDDKPENLRLLNTILSENDYDVRPATNGRQALQVAERSTPDLVLLDIEMPEMDGYAVCRELKAIESLRDVPVIFLTARTETEDKLKAFNAGGVDYVLKPFQVDEVLARVRVHVALRRARKELSENYERLQTLERVRDDLVNMIVHDMRSPLLAMLLLLTTVQKRLDSDPKSASILETAMKSVRNLSQMTNDLLDVRRLEEGKLPLNLQECDVLALVREVAGTFSGGTHTVVVVDGTEPVGASCDRVVVRRILENLISNAVKHTPSHTAITVSAVLEETSVRIEVRDKGQGVALEARERIFEKFATIQLQAASSYHSAGLGLAFCKLAVRAHGGGIGVDDGAGGGSVFWFDLPRSRA